MVCTVSAFGLMLCCGVALWAMFSITPCANIELPVLQSILDMFMTWFMFSCYYHCLGMSQWANIRNVNSLVVKHYVESKKDTLAYGFLKPEYPFNAFFLWFDLYLMKANQGNCLLSSFCLWVHNFKIALFLLFLEDIT